MSAVNFELADTMSARLSNLLTEMPARVKRIVRLEAEYARTIAIEQYMPDDNGHLRASARVHPPEIDGSEVSCTISVGNNAAPYALAIHEHPSASSPPSWEGKPIDFIFSVRGRIAWGLGDYQRGPKYLERALRDVGRGMAARIERQLFAGGGAR